MTTPTPAGALPFPLAGNRAATEVVEAWLASPNRPSGPVYASARDLLARIDEAIAPAIAELVDDVLAHGWTAEADRLDAAAQLDAAPPGEVDMVALRLHLFTKHCNVAALSLSDADALDDHAHEHRGPGTIRNHDPADVSWDRDRAIAMLAEAGEDLTTAGPPHPVALALAQATAEQLPTVGRWPADTAGPKEPN